MSILLPSSNLKRSPSIGYDKRKTKHLYPNLPFELFQDKIKQIIEDLELIIQKSNNLGKIHIFNQDSKEFKLPNNFKVDAVIRSPPYLNSFDYIGNYKLEIG